MRLNIPYPTPLLTLQNKWNMTCHIDWEPYRYPHKMPDTHLCLFCGPLKIPSLVRISSTDLQPPPPSAPTFEEWRSTSGFQLPESGLELAGFIEFDPEESSWYAYMSCPPLPAMYWGYDDLRTLYPISKPILITSGSSMLLRISYFNLCLQWPGRTAIRNLDWIKGLES